MGYQESLVFVQPQWNFKKLIRAYERAEQDGYYAVAGAEPRSVVVLKQPIGELPAGARLLWVCGDRGFHTPGGVFGGHLNCRGRVRFIPAESVLDSADSKYLRGIDLESPCPSENEYMRRFSAANYAHRLRAGLAR